MINSLQQDTLLRKIAQNNVRIKRIEALLSGQPLSGIRFANAIITAAKIANISADKITSGSISVGQEITVNDGINDRILIDDTQIKISKPGFDVHSADTKDLVILSQENAHKLLYKGYPGSSTYTHGMGHKIVFYVFDVDNPSSPTAFTLDKTAKVNTTQVTDIITGGYLVAFREGI
jgi:hypothetical protein